MMKWVARTMMLLFVVGFQVRPSVAQGCRLDYTANYDTYVSVTMDSTKLYSTVLVDGSTSGSGSAGCFYPNATHTPKSYNKLGSVGGWVTGPAGYMNSYVSIENDQNANLAGIPGTIELDWGANVICSVFGSFYATGGSPLIYITTTYGKNDRGYQDIYNVRFCNYDPKCTSGTPTCGNGGWNTHNHQPGQACEPVIKMRWGSFTFKGATVCSGYPFPDDTGGVGGHCT